MELNRQLSRSLSLNEKLNSENRAENIEALRTRLRQTEQQLTSETDNRKRADAEVVAWKFKYEKAEQEKLYAQTHQKTVEVAVEKKVPYEKCEKCDRTAYQKAKEKCDNRKSQLEKKYKNMTTGYESILFLLAWYSISSDIKSMWYRFSRRDSDYCIECSEDGINFRQMRIFHMWEGAEKITYGIYACSPTEGSYKATFSNMQITECKWESDADWRD